MLLPRLLRAVALSMVVAPSPWRARPSQAAWEVTQHRIATADGPAVVRGFGVNLFCKAASRPFRAQLFHSTLEVTSRAATADGPRATLDVNLSCKTASVLAFCKVLPLPPWHSRDQNWSVNATTSSRRQIGPPGHGVQKSPSSPKKVLRTRPRA